MDPPKVGVGRTTCTHSPKKKKKKIETTNKKEFLFFGFYCPPSKTFSAPRREKKVEGGKFGGGEREIEVNLGLAFCILFFFFLLLFFQFPRNFSVEGGDREGVHETLGVGDAYVERNGR